MPFYQVEFFEKGGWSKFVEEFKTLNDAKSAWNNSFSRYGILRFVAHRFVWREGVFPHAQRVVFDATGPSFNEFERVKAEHDAHDRDVAANF